MVCADLTQSPQKRMHAAHEFSKIHHARTGEDVEPLAFFREAEQACGQLSHKRPVTRGTGGSND
ncbi:hypothetical protein DUNSADRAFT_4113 [Dunaliella salina]|uniref:Encoded protein n=1 Tax=Dunaliella salina TaxID=3046 RepID=A0ABQ7GSL9_DUNSA|nr:hypothetical protein DUNSADRAFT_4113 [Dunaliella salina]|eukprot:KAF5837610.1 hypothetical protein DUNSADRAFT_4113 [Dunaliella salina]